MITHELTNDYLLFLIENSKHTNGPQVNELVKQLKDLGINTYDKQVMTMIKELVDRGLIYQINPRAKRAWRFKLNN